MSALVPSELKQKIGEAGQKGMPIETIDLSDKLDCQLPRRWDTRLIVYALKQYGILSFSDVADIVCAARNAKTRNGRIIEAEPEYEQFFRRYIYAKDGPQGIRNYSGIYKRMRLIRRMRLCARVRVKEPCWFWTGPGEPKQPLTLSRFIEAMGEKTARRLYFKGILDEKLKQKETDDAECQLEATATTP